MLCGNCGREITDNSKTCIYCGNAAAAKPFNVCALLSMIFGLISPIFCWIAFIPGIASIILGAIGIAHANNNNSGKKGMAITGIIVSAVTMGIYTLFFLILVAEGDI